MPDEDLNFEIKSIKNPTGLRSVLGEILTDRQKTTFYLIYKLRLSLGHKTLNYIKYRFKCTNKILKDITQVRYIRI